MPWIITTPILNRPLRQVPVSFVGRASSRLHGSLFTARSDVQMALKAGFTMEEVIFMLDLPASFENEGNVDSEDLGPMGIDIVRKID